MAEEKVSIIYQFKDMASNALMGLTKKLDQLSLRAEEAKKKFESLGKFGQGLAKGAGVISASFAFLGTQALKAAGNLEQQGIAFKGLLGSAEAADKVIARIRKEAAATPFDIPGLTSMTSQLATITKDGDKAVDILMNVGDAIAMSGKDIVEMERVVQNLQQVASTGKITAMDIKQFQGAIPLFNDIISAAGLTTAELQSSENAAELLFKAFENAAKEGGVTFGGLANQSKSLNGVLATLGDNFGGLVRQLGEGLLPIVKPIVNYFNGLLDKFQDLSPKTKTFAAIVVAVVFGLSTLLTVLGGVLAILPAVAAGWALVGGAISAAIWPVTLGVIGVTALVLAFTKFKVLQPILAGLTVAFGIFWAAATGGILPLIAGITALVGWLLKLGGVFDSLSQKMDKNNKKIEETKEKLKEAQESGDDKAVEKLEAKLKKLEAVKKKYEEKDKVKKEEEKAGNEEDKLAKLAEQKEKEKELELQKDQEKANALAEQKAKQKEEQDAIDKEWKEIIAEEEKAQQEEKDEAERERWLAMSEEEVNATKLTQEQKNMIILAQERKKNIEREKASKEYVSFLSAAGEKEKDIGKAVAQGTLNWAKDGLKAKARAFGEGLIAEGLATLPMVLLGDPSPLLKMAAGASVVAGAPSAINSIQLAEGGSMIVDQPTRIGNNVLAGEAGPERIDVTPLNEQQPQTVNNIIQLDGEVLARQVLKLGQGMRSEGTVDDGL